MIPSIGVPFKMMDTNQQINFAENLIQKMSKDQRFKPLESHVKDLASKLEEWQVAIQNAQSGGKIKTIKKIEKGLSVKNRVFYLATQIEIMAEHNQEIILASGYKTQRKKVTLSQKAFSSQQLEDLLITMA